MRLNRSAMKLALNLWSIANKEEKLNQFVEKFFKGFLLIVIRDNHLW